MIKFSTTTLLLVFRYSCHKSGCLSFNNPKTFTVNSEKAYILKNDPDIVYMTNMHVILYLSKGRVVNIVSSQGRYNKVTYDCFFEKNVKATDGETNGPK